MSHLFPPDRHAQQFSCRDFLHHLDLKITFRHQLLQTRVLALKLFKTLDVVRLETAEPFLPQIN